MRNCTKFMYPVLLTLFISLAGCAGTQSSPPATAPTETPAARSASPVTGIAAETVITVHGKIVAVDSATKQVTLQGPGSKNITLTVNNPYNLQSLKAGDRYVAQFTEAISIVGKGPSDAPPVASVAAGLWTAAPGQTPGVAAVQQARLVVVVAAVDQADQRIT